MPLPLELFFSHVLPHRFTKIFPLSTRVFGTRIRLRVDWLLVLYSRIPSDYEHHANAT